MNGQTILDTWRCAYQMEQKPNREVVNCGPPDNPTGGIFHLNENGNTQFNATATLNCKIGYKPYGSRRTTCLADGNWEILSGSCDAVDCGIPIFANTYPFRVIAENGSLYNSVIRLGCVSGYIFQGNPLIICLESGSWSTNEMKCEVIDCGPPPLLEFGSYKIPSNLTQFNHTVFYTCQERYKLYGRDRIRCLSNGSWSASTIRFCEVWQCVQPPHVDFALYQGTTEFELLSKVIYSCIKGYNLIGYNSIYCQYSGEWSEIEFSCKIVDCKHPPILEGGFVTLKDNLTTYEKTAIYECHYGYQLSNNLLSFSVKCQENGQWTNLSEKCIKVGCGPPHPLKNGNFLAPNRLSNFDEIITYFCNTGYFFSGEKESMCLENGSWTVTLRGCEILNCGKPPKIEHAKVILLVNSTKYGANATYYCDDMYNMDGQNKILCLDTGRWSQIEFECQFKGCGKPQLIRNGIVRLRIKAGRLRLRKKPEPYVHATYYCNNGYMLLGMQTSLCLQNGSWTRIDTKCLERLPVPISVREAAPIIILLIIIYFVMVLRIALIGDDREIPKKANLIFKMQDI